MGRWLPWLALIVAACGEPEPGARRFELRVASLDAREIDGEVPDEPAVRQAIGEAVSRSRTLLATEGAAPVLATRVRLGEIASASGTRVLRVEFEADVPAAQHAVLGRAINATIELERHDGTLVAEEDVPMAMSRAVGVLDAKLQLLTGGPDDARRLLGDADAEIVLLALEQIGRQRWRPVAGAVAALLPADDERVAAAAIECLGIVGGPEHTPILLRHARLADRDQAQRLYEALAALGGDEAASFLEFAARNEDDPDMADVAARALRRLHGVPEPDPRQPGPSLRGHRP